VSSFFSSIFLFSSLFPLRSQPQRQDIRLSDYHNLYWSIKDKKMPIPLIVPAVVVVGSCVAPFVGMAAAGTL
jgi:hypothetical protein